MSLLICEDCGNGVSSHAARCPKCGSPVPRMQSGVPSPTQSNIHPSQAEGGGGTNRGPVTYSLYSEIFSSFFYWFFFSLAGINSGILYRMLLSLPDDSYYSEIGFGMGAVVGFVYSLSIFIAGIVRKQNRNYLFIFLHIPLSVFFTYAALFIILQSHLD